MTRQFRLAVVRASTDGSRLPDDVVFDHVWQGSSSLLRYWTDATDGWFDFTDSAFLPWVDITVDPAKKDRWTTAGSVVAAVRAANPGHDPFAGFDGLLVLLHPGGVVQRDSNGNAVADSNGRPVLVPGSGFDGGSSALGSLPFSVVPTVPSDHTFACHELGHTLGADHTFGVDNSGVDYAGTGALSAEYGSPYDLMSSASFGSRGAVSGVSRGVDPTFVGQEPAGWPGGASMGPAMSRANVHRWFPDAFAAGSVIDAPFPGPGQSVAHRLAAAGAGSGHRLLVLHPGDEAPDGVGRVYVEYRPPQGWDAGFDGVGGGMARAGVVIHTLEAVAGKSPHVWFRGSVGDDDVDTDLTLAVRPLTLTVTQRGTGDEHWVEVRVTGQASLAAVATVTHVDSIVGGTVTGHRQTPCGDQVELGDWQTSTSATVRVTTTGLEPAVTDPVVRVDWTLGGQPLAGAAGRGRAVTVTAGGSHTVDWSVDPATHALTVVTAAGAAFSVEVVATVTASDAAGSPNGQVTATAVVTAAGGYSGMKPEGIRAVGSCWGQRAKSVGVDLTLDVAALLDHHEVIQWEQDATRLGGLIATATGPVAKEFQTRLEIGAARFQVQDHGLAPIQVVRPR